MTTFRASARTVDLLGRQQIAGIPTAISELFKNAHDAYARHVEADYLRWDDTFVLRDDGVGMSRADFEIRWLTLGTDSKLLTASLPAPPTIPGLRTRPLLGEKGIGRLAVAAIGPQLLVLSRAYRGGGGMSPLVAAFVNWELFEVPGINLDEVPVPVIEITDGAIPDSSHVLGLVDEVLASLDVLQVSLDETSEQRIRGHLERFKSIDPRALDEALGGLSLRKGPGTHFIVSPTAEGLLPAIAEPDDRYRTSGIRRALVGFTNTIDEAPDEIVPAFRDHKTRDSFDELIGGSSFFTPDEFRSADHHIRGNFDEYGQFRGTVTVYGLEPVDHVVAYRSAAGRQTDCGPFALNLAVVQGELRASLLASEQWSQVIQKLDKIGGLYVYRNGIRILPYGDSDVDWVDIEFRRTKSASYYFFSYRRMFGYVDISSGPNDNLIEKAGREGFIENRAYRQLKEILSNFFQQTAADFFREGGAESEQFSDTRRDLDRQAKIRQERERQARTRRAGFEQALSKTGQAIAEGEIDAEAAAIIDRLHRDIDSAAHLGEPDDVAREFIASEQRARRGIAELRARYRVSAPRGFALTRTLRREFEGHRTDWARVEETTLGPAESMIETAVTEAASNYSLSVDRRRRFEEAIDDAINEARHTARDGERTADEALDAVQGRIREIRTTAGGDLNRTIAEIEAQVASVDVSGLTDEQFVARRSELEEAVISLAERERTTLLSVAEQLGQLNWGRNGESSATELTEALEDELLELRARSSEDLELAQLGMAIGVINHEFDSSIRAVRANLRRLRSWADVNEPLQKLYRNLRSSFDHLDGYLTLFTPLQRRLYRERVTITGAEIEEFLRDLFARRLERHAVRLTASKGFRSFQIEGYPSTFYPVFVNLVDNAIFWLTDSPEPRVIRLDADGDALLVEDTGPGVPTRDREAIFERGFTRRPGGQGLGLYIARAVLEREGYSLDLGTSAAGSRFVIKPTQPEDDAPEQSAETS